MGFFSVFKKVAHTVSHPASALKKIERAVVKAEKKVSKTIVKAATIVEKVGKATVKEADKTLTFVENHAKDIKTVVDITATIVEVIGVATGQPEIVAGAAALQAAADKALDLAAKARKVVNVVDKATLVAQSIREKEKISKTLHKIADTAQSAGEINGNKQLMNIAGHIKTGANVVDKAIDHTKEIHSIVRQTASAVESRDIAGTIKGIIKGVK